MKLNVFIDANILVSVLNKEYPVFPDAARVLSWVTDNGHKLYTTSLCLAIAFYFAEKKHGSRIVKEKIELLAQHFEIAECNKPEVLQALQNKKVKDFEDGLQYYAAKNSFCDCIVTEDIGDYYFAITSVYNAEAFLRKYAKKR